MSVRISLALEGHDSKRADLRFIWKIEHFDFEYEHVCCILHSIDIATFIVSKAPLGIMTSEIATKTIHWNFLVNQWINAQLSTWEQALKALSVEELLTYDDSLVRSYAQRRSASSFCGDPRD